MRLSIVILASLAIQSCATTKTYDLVITNASVFDTEKGVVLEHKTILINADTIAGVTDNDSDVKGRKTIDAAGRLVTPGFIDTHIHPQHIIGESTPAQLQPDSLAYYRKKFADVYLSYGVTTAMMMGQPEIWIKPIVDWSAHPAAAYPDMYTTGAALISDEERTPYIGHIEVASPEAARKKIIAYYQQGIRHIKLYWRLREPEFKAAKATADSLGMRTYGHIDQGIMLIDSTLTLGLTNYEHIFTVAFSATRDEDAAVLIPQLDQYYGKNKWQQLSFFESTIELVNYAMKYKPKSVDSLLDRLAAYKATFSTTIQLFAERMGVSEFTNPKNQPDSSWSEERRQHYRDCFSSFMQLAKRMHEKGISLRIGTDCMNGGKAAVTEQVLLAQYGFTVPDIIRISTINGARAIGMENKYGSVAKGKKANLVIYSKSPMDDYHNFLSARVVIKDGAEFHQ